MIFVDKPLTGCERAVNGVLLSRRCNLQENRSKRLKKSTTFNVCTCPSCRKERELENALFFELAHSRGEHDLNLVKVPPIDPQDADKSMLQ